MNISIRDHIVENFLNDSEEIIRDAINSSVLENDEEVLPGLGVFFTLMWENADDSVKATTVKLIREKLDQIKQQLLQFH